MRLSDAKAVYVGDRPAKAVYLGDRKLWPTGPEVLFEDTFTRPNAATLGAPWTEHTGTWAVLDNRGRAVSDSGGVIFICAATVNIGQSTKAIEWTWPILSLSACYQIVRYVDPDNMIFVGGTASSATTAFLLQRLGGSVTVLNQSTSVTWGNNTLIRAEDAGTGISVSFDGVQKLSATTSQFNTSTRCGIGGNAQTTGTADTRLHQARISRFRAEAL